MHYYIRWIQWQLNKPRVQMGIFVGSAIVILSMIGWFIASRANLTKVRLSYENCVKLGLESGKDYFEAKCKADPECDEIELTEVEMDGFIQYAENIRQECEAKYK